MRSTAPYGRQPPSSSLVSFKNHMLPVKVFCPYGGGFQGHRLYEALIKFLISTSRCDSNNGDNSPLW